MKTLPFSIGAITVIRNGNTQVFFNGEKLIIGEQQKNLVALHHHDCGYLEFSSALQAEAFLYAKESFVTSKESLLQTMNTYIERVNKGAAMLKDIRNNHFFKQLAGVKLDGNTAVKIYGNSIYMNSVKVELNEKEITVINSILAEAVNYFANYEETELKKIANSVVIQRMFDLYYAGVDAGNFDVTTPVFFNKIAHENA